MEKKINNNIDGIKPIILNDFLDPEVSKSKENIQIAVSGVIHISEETGNENNEDIWMLNGGEINENGIELNGEIFDGIHDIFKINGGLIAIVFKYQEKLYGKHETKIANEGKDPSEYVDKTFIKRQKVKEYINLNTGEKIDKMIDIFNIIKDNSINDEEYNQNLERFKKVINK